MFSTCISGSAQGSSSASSDDPGGGKAIVKTVNAGSDIILDCATGSGAKADLIEWRKNGSKSAIFIKFMNFKPHVDSKYSRRLHMVNESAILISNIEASDAGIYRCKTMSSGGTDTVFSQGTAIVLKVKGMDCVLLFAESCAPLQMKAKSSYRVHYSSSV